MQRRSHAPSSRRPRHQVKGRENAFTLNASVASRSSLGGGTGGPSKLRSQSTTGVTRMFQSRVPPEPVERGKPGEVVLMSKKYRRSSKAAEPKPQMRTIDSQKYGQQMRERRVEAEESFMQTLMASMESSKPKRQPKADTVRPPAAKDRLHPAFWRATPLCRCRPSRLFFAHRQVAPRLTQPFSRRPLSAKTLSPAKTTCVTSQPWTAKCLWFSPGAKHLRANAA